MLRHWVERWRRLSPHALFVVSFAALITIGTSGLFLIPGLYVGEPLGFVDALFTMTSAVCVTGLIVVDTATYFTRWGQLWILLFVQLGGLGLITLTTLIIGALGRRLSLRSEMITVPTATYREGRPEVSSVARAAAKFTFVVEAFGAVALWPQFWQDFGPGDAAWHALFQSVSAFCNAGFSTFSTSLEDYAERPLVPLTISVLVVLGGLGYLTTTEVLRWWRGRKHERLLRLSSHSFASVTMTAVLLALGTLLFAAFEWHGVLAEMGLLDRLVNAWFMSVTPRTAGFNTIPYGSVGNGTAFLTILLMTIGGSPGSMAGGIKTTTAAILIALALARIRGRRQVELHGRTVPEATVERTASLALVASGLVIAAVFLLSMTEMRGQPLAEERAAVLPLIFETVSAFGTVGLSMGVTPTLETSGRLFVIVLMFLGRVGPLAFFAALSFRKARLPAGMRAAREDVVVG